MYYTNKWGELTQIPDLPVGAGSPQEKLTEAQATRTSGMADEVSQERMSQEKRAIEEQATREKIAHIQAEAQVAAAAARTGSGGASGDQMRRRYNKGGPVITSEFKHAHPTYAAYGKSGDGSLLAKGRK